MKAQQLIDAVVNGKDVVDVLEKTGDYAGHGKFKDERIKCPFCGTTTWSTDYTSFMRDHDTPDGKVCRQAQNQQNSK